MIINLLGFFVFVYVNGGAYLIYFQNFALILPYCFLDNKVGTVSARQVQSNTLTGN